MPIAAARPPRVNAVRAGIVVFLAALALSCREDDLTTGPSVPEPRPALAISDAAHAGKSHFYFLPPLVPAPGVTGGFDGSLSPEVRVCRLAGASCGPEIVAFTASTSPALTVDPIGEAYKVAWQTKDAGLLTTETYRIRVLVGSALLGFADLRVVANNKDLAGLPADMIGLVQGKTLQIKFRIEQGVVGTIRVAPGSNEVEVREHRQYQVLYFDLHAQPLSTGAAAQWSSSDPSVLSIESGGLAIGQSLGGAVLTAAAEGLTTSANVHVYRKIAFVSNRDGNDEIYLIHSTGTGLQRLTDNAGTDTDPSWSPDGSRIAFSRATAGGLRVFLMNADGSGVTPLSTSASLVQDQRPRWSPDGQRIAFRRDVQSAESGLYVIGADGSGQSHISDAIDWYAPEWIRGYPMSWSPGSDRLTFVRNNDLYVVNANGTGEILIAPGFVWSQAEWSPGSKILALRYDTKPYTGIDEVSALLTVNPDGTDLTLVTGESVQPLELYSFAWSPTAARVAYTNLVTPSNIYTIDADGDASTLFSVTRGEEDVVHDYSADGKALVFVRRDNELFPRFQLWVVRADGTGLLALARSAQSDNAVPAWRP